MRISASFHHDSRRDRTSSDMARDTIRKISFKPTNRGSSHAPTGQPGSPGTGRGAAPMVCGGASALVAQVFGTHRFSEVEAGWPDAYGVNPLPSNSGG